MSFSHKFLKESKAFKEFGNRLCGEYVIAVLSTIEVLFVGLVYVVLDLPFLDT